MLRFVLLCCLFPGIQSVAQTSFEPFFTGKTTGTLPYLEYGHGTDRLGGAKIGFLDTNVVMKVVDSTFTGYKIQLSANHYAFLPKSNFKRDSLTSIRPYYLTGSWGVYGDSLSDFLSVMLDAPLPYRSHQLINPSRIVVDVFGATTNTNWITQRSSAKEIKNVYHEQIEDDVFRITIELNHKQHWGHSIYYKDGRLMVRVKRPPAIAALPYLKIAIDAGHGGTNNGASGKKTGILEKNYTLMMAKELQRALLAEEATVFMTREEDISLSMNERVERIREQDPHFLLSIHLNSSVKDSIKGVSTYYKHIGFRPMSQFILDRMLETGLSEFGNIGSFNFMLNGPTDYPNCLVEVAFLSNAEDEQRILDPNFHKLIAAKIVQGLRDWLERVNSE